MSPVGKLAVARLVAGGVSREGVVWGMAKGGSDQREAHRQTEAAVNGRRVLPTHVYGEIIQGSSCSMGPGVTFLITLIALQ